MTNLDFAEEVRRADPERFVGTLLAPPQHRNALVTLLAFNLELAQTRERVTETMAGRIRLQWWRDALGEIATDAVPRRHPLVEALAAMQSRRGLPLASLMAMIDAREVDLDEEAPADLDALERYAAGTAGALACARTEILGAQGENTAMAARSLGVAWALVGLLRSVPFHAAADRCYLPVALTSAEGLDVRSLFAGQSSAPLRRVVATIAGRAAEQLRTARAPWREIPRAAAPVFAEARLIDRHLALLSRTGFDPFDARVARRDPLTAWRLLAARLGRRY